MTSRIVATCVSAIALTCSAALVEAQGAPPAGQAAVRAGVQPRAGQRQGEAARLLQERRLQERINQVVRQRLNLNDDQMTKLQAVATRIEDDRRVLRNEEMTSRFALRQELLAGDKADEGRVSTLLDKLAEYERRRLTLMEREQKELAKFLSATQRARYVGVQEELRRSMQEVQRRRTEGELPGPAAAVRRPNRPPA